MDEATTAASHYDVVILGAGYAGLMAALRLGGAKDHATGKPQRIALINGSDQFVERARLQETVAKPIAARIPSISGLLAGSAVDFICAQVVALDVETRSVRIVSASGERQIYFQRALYALGSLTDTETVPGVDAHAYRLDPGDGPRTAAALRAALAARADRDLRVVVVGGGATAIEAAGEIKAHFPVCDVTIICRGRCGDFKNDPVVERSLRAELIRLGVRIIDETDVVEVRATEVLTAERAAVPFGICVWSGGLRSGQLARNAGLATDDQGRIFTDPMLRSISHPLILAAGDAAHPIAPTGAPYRQSVFAALTSGAFVAEVMAAGEGAGRPQPFSFSTYGQGIAIGSSGVGFLAYPNDRKRLFIIGGRAGYHTRNFFVFLSTYLLKHERSHPGFFARWVWAGQRRISWDTANRAMQIEQRVQTA